MQDFLRRHVATLLARLAEAPNYIIAVFGPRQTGKSTLVQQALRRCERPHRYFNLDEVASEPDQPRDADAAALPRKPDGAWLADIWQEVREEADRHPQGIVLALDEIQRIPEWSSTVKGLWDVDRAANRQVHVVVLGSAPLLMQSGLTESLAGRFETIHATHWSFAEMSEAFGFNLAEYIYFGGYPGGARFIRDEARWRDYILNSLVAPNIERDILAMSRVEKPALMKRLFEVAAAHSGQIHSYNKMLGQLQDVGNTVTLASYLSLLSSAGLVRGLQRYSGSDVQRRASSPKLNVLNTALMTAGSGYTFAEARADRTYWGQLVESAVGAHLINTAANNEMVQYWRHGGDEVDFVLSRGPRTVGIEVKSGRSRRTSGMGAFERKYPHAQTMVVGDGGIALADFLATASTDDWFKARDDR